MTPTHPKQTVFQLKSSQHALTTLYLFNTDPVEWQKQLNHTLQQAPRFFEELPLILNLEHVDGSVDLEALCTLLRRYRLMPIALQQATDDQQAQARRIGLALFNTKSAQHHKAYLSSHRPAMIVNHKIRSGQQIYAKKTDLIVLTSTSSGAELMADGHIHVYGTLSGRALAGVSGDESARIFCQHLDAELISIAGFYQLSEQFPLSKSASYATHIYLEQRRLVFSNTIQ